MKKILLTIILTTALGQFCYSQETITDPSKNKSETTTKTDKEVFTVVEEMPKYAGGEDARLKFLQDNIKYPELAMKNKIQGTVYISFVIETDGSVSNIKILRGIGGGCDEEAMRVVMLMPKWSPGKQRGENVRVQFNLPLKFSL